MSSNYKTNTKFQIRTTSTQHLMRFSRYHQEQFQILDLHNFKDIFENTFKYIIIFYHPIDSLMQVRRFIDELTKVPKAKSELTVVK